MVRSYPQWRAYRLDARPRMVKAAINRPAASRARPLRIESHLYPLHSFLHHHAQWHDVRMPTPALTDRATINVYLSRKDKEQLDEIAADSGLSTSGYIRTQVIERILKMHNELQSQNWDIE
jgi:Ribbon-helix-helix protein, copG family